MSQPRYQDLPHQITCIDTPVAGIDRIVCIGVVYDKHTGIDPVSCCLGGIAVIAVTDSVDPGRAIGRDIDMDVPGPCDRLDSRLLQVAVDLFCGIDETC